MLRKPLRSLRRRFGIAAPRMTVRTHVAWYWRALGVVAALSVSLALAMWMYDAGRRFAGFDVVETQGELETLRARNAALDAEATRLRSVANASESTLKIERTAQAKLAQQVKALESENARLKEDIAFFETVSARDRTEDRVSVYRFKVENDVMPGEYRYRLLVMQGGKDREFQGRLQLVVDMQRDGKDVIVTIPDEKSEVRDYRISFKRFFRAEGSFRVDPSAKVRSVQVRVLEQGVSQPRATQSFSLS